MNENYKIAGTIGKLYFNEDYIFQLRELIKTNNKKEVFKQSDNIINILDGKKADFFISLNGTKELLIELESFLKKINYQVECCDFYFKIIETNEFYKLT